MTFNPKIWRPIAIVLSAVNLVATGFAAQGGEGLHAGVHAALALAFGLWAQNLRPRPSSSGQGEIGERLESLEIEVGNLRRELGEAQERLDFTERVMAQAQEQRRVGPDR
ncbi:MAG TPA: hypothetical protein VH438_14960 [Gemmatimonadales bacterium]